MCTAMAWQGLFGRNLDLEYDIPCAVTLTPRHYPLPNQTEHHAILGMALVQDNFPLYFDAFNEAGLAMAGLHFPNSAHYNSPQTGSENVPSWQLIPWLLGQCGNLAAVRQILARLNITDEAFSPTFPPSPLHWLIADTADYLVLEACRDGLHWYDAPVGVLTNEPPFPQQMDRFAQYRHLSPAIPDNTLFPETELLCVRGSGAWGMPGDVTSVSRFIRAAFHRRHAVPGDVPAQTTAQFFHILDSVAQIKGCVQLPDGSLEYTRYTSCCDLTRGSYAYKTAWDSTAKTVYLQQGDLNCDRLQILSR